MFLLFQFHILILKSDICLAAAVMPTQYYSAQPCDTSSVNLCSSISKFLCMVSLVIERD